MERCLKKPLLEAETMGFGDSGRAAGRGWDYLEENIVLRGLDLGQIGVCF
jgi:hypothetical protein